MRRAGPVERADSHGRGPRFIAIQCIFFARKISFMSRQASPVRRGARLKKRGPRLTLLAPGFFGWCSTGGGVFSTPLHNSFVFKVRLVKFCTDLLWNKMNILR